MKNIENIFYLLVSADSDKKTGIFSCECPFSLPGVCVRRGLRRGYYENPQMTIKDD